MSSKKKSKIAVTSGASGKKTHRPLRVLIGNGVNLDLLGRREVSHYGRFTLQDVATVLQAEVGALAALAGLGAVELSLVQSNDEAEFLQMLDQGWDGAVLNPGAWTHTSLALADRLTALKLPYVECHISNVAARESIRQHSHTAAAASGVVFGLGLNSYRAALFALLCHLATIDPASRRQRLP